MSRQPRGKDRVDEYALVAKGMATRTRLLRDPEAAAVDRARLQAGADRVTLAADRRIRARQPDAPGIEAQRAATRRQLDADPTVHRVGNLRVRLPGNQPRAGRRPGASAPRAGRGGADPAVVRSAAVAAVRAAYRDAVRDAVELEMARRTLRDFGMPG